MKIFLLFFLAVCGVNCAAKPPVDTVVSITNTTIFTSTGSLFGSLSVPIAEGKVPIVLIIAGSGPTDRNGNSGRALNTNCYKILADSLLKYGIASLRYDKRGAAESAASVIDPVSFRFINYVNDAVDAIKLLKADNRFSQIVVIGHSEGSLVGMIAAKMASADKYVSIAGAGFPIQDVLRKQFMAQPEAYQAMLLTRLDTLVAGKLLTNVPAELNAIFNPMLQPYLMNWFTYIPATEIAKLNIPVLILNGTTDIQVGVEQANNLHKACKQSKLVIVNGMNHLLKEAPLDRQKNLATYTNAPNAPIKTELVQAIKNFVKATKK